MTTDPDPSERLVALRSNRSPQPFPHAQATKIVTAGISMSAVFGIVAYLGHSAEVQAVEKSHELQRVAVSQAAAGELYRPPATVVPVTVPPATVTPTTTPTTTPTVLRPGDIAVTPPVSVPPVVVAVPVPVPVTPAPRPASPNTPSNQTAQGGQGVAAPAPSNTTKSSG